MEKRQSRSAPHKSRKSSPRERHTGDLSLDGCFLCGRNSSRRSTGRTGFLERQGACLRKAEIEHERHREASENTQSKAAR